MTGLQTKHWITNCRKCSAAIVCVCIIFYLSIYSDAFKRISLQKHVTDQFDSNDVVRVHGDVNFSSVNSTAVPLLSRQTVEPVVHVRSERVKELCHKLNINDAQQDTRDRLLLARSLGVAMCYVPKAGCTFWKRVFIALQTNTTDVFKLTKNQAHTRSIDTLAKLVSFDAAHGFLSKATRVIFVRDPYSRLYSGYIDKFYLGDFWRSMGKGIIRSIRPNASEKSLLCGHDLTFQEFLKYALSVAQKQHSSGGEEHWFPISKLCQPCTFNYHIIGKQETFSSDRDHVMHELGISSMIDNSMSPEVVVRDSMKQTIDMSWNIVTGCMSRKDMAIRMWTSYIDQGYIHKSQSLPQDKVSEGTSKEDFLALAMEAYTAHIPTSEERQQQRREAMVTAYSSISSYTLSMIQKVFRLDFELFDYPTQPDDLFRSYR